MNTNNHLELIDVRNERKNQANWYVTGTIYRYVGDIEGDQIENWFVDIKTALDFISNELS